MAEISAVSFQSTLNQSPKVQTNTTSVINNTEDKKLSKGTKVAIGTGLAALATIGIYIATRGKNNKAISDLNKFVNGKYVDKNGNGVTGVVNKARKDGTNLVMTYENGVLKESKIMSGETVKSSKTYAYDTNGKISAITNHNGKITTLEHDAETGKLIKKRGKTGNNDFYYTKDGSLKYMSGYKIPSESKNPLIDDRAVDSELVVEFSPTTKKPIIGYEGEKYKLVAFDNDGKVSSVTKLLRDDTLDMTQMIEPVTKHDVLLYSKKINNESFWVYGSIKYLRGKNDIGKKAGSQKLRLETPDYDAEINLYTKYHEKGKKKLNNLNPLDIDIGHNSYTLKQTSKDTVQIDNIATWNTKTGEIVLLPNAGKTLDEVQGIVNIAKEASNKMYSSYRNIYREQNSNADFVNIAENLFPHV